MIDVVVNRVDNLRNRILQIIDSAIRYETVQSLGNIAEAIVWQITTLLQRSYMTSSGQ